MPMRIQRQRRKGWKKPENAVCVTRPGRWGNPWTVITGLSPTEMIEHFTIYANRRLADEPDWLTPLHGKDLACWCPVEAPACHADVLLRLANRPLPVEVKPEVLNCRSERQNNHE